MSVTTPEEARRRIVEIDNRVKDLRYYLKASGRISVSTHKNIKRIMDEALGQRKRLRNYLIANTPVKTR